LLALLPLGFAAAALAQTITNPPPSTTGPGAPAQAAPVSKAPLPAQALAGAPAADAPAAPPTPPQGGTQLMLRGLDKITGRPTSIIAPINASGGRPRWVMPSFRSFGMLVKLTKLLNIVAAIRIVNSMAVVRALSTSTSSRLRSVNAPRASAKQKAPEAPMPAPSVAVKKPP
jgi:hypothetical protein